MSANQVYRRPQFVRKRQRPQLADTVEKVEVEQLQDLSFEAAIWDDVHISM
jgi:hypothetical protein